MSIEAGYHFYNENESEFVGKEYPPDKIAAISYAAGLEAGRHEIKEKVVKVFKPEPANGVWA